MPGEPIGTKPAGPGGDNLQGYDKRGLFTSKGKEIISSSPLFNVFNAYGGGDLSTSVAAPKKADFPDMASFAKAMKEFKEIKDKFYEATSMTDAGVDELDALPDIDMDSLIEEADKYNALELTNDPEEIYNRVVNLATPEFVKDLQNELNKYWEDGERDESLTQHITNVFARGIFGVQRLEAISEDELEALNPVSKVVNNKSEFDPGEQWHVIYRGFGRSLKGKNAQQTIDGLFIDDNEHVRGIYGTGGFDTMVYCSTDVNMALNSYGSAILLKGIVNVGQSRLFDKKDFDTGTESWRDVNEVADKYIINPAKKSFKAHKQEFIDHIKGQGVSLEEAEKIYNTIDNGPRSTWMIMAGYDGCIGDIYGTENQISFWNPRIVKFIPHNYTPKAGEVTKLW